MHFLFGKAIEVSMRRVDYSEYITYLIQNTSSCILDELSSTVVFSRVSYQKSLFKEQIIPSAPLVFLICIHIVYHTVVCSPLLYSK